MQIKKIRKELDNISQEDFGKLFGVTGRHIRNWESGETEVRQIYKDKIKTLIKEKRAEKKKRRKKK